MITEEDMFEKRALEIERNMYKALYEDEATKRKDLLGKLIESDKEEQYQNTLLAQKCSDLADELKDANNNLDILTKAVFESKHELGNMVAWCHIEDALKEITHTKREKK